MFPWIQRSASRFPGGGVATHAASLQVVMSPQSIELRKREVEKTAKSVFGDVRDFEDLTERHRGRHPLYSFTQVTPSGDAYDVTLGMKIKQTTNSSVVYAAAKGRYYEAANIEVTLNLGPVNTARMLDPKHTAEYAENVLRKLQMYLMENPRTFKRVQITERLDGVRRR